MTATPDRGDGKGLDDLFDEIVWSYDLLWGIRSGYLSDIRGLSVHLQLDMSKVKVSRGDYDAGSSGRALEDAGAPSVIVKAWREHADGRRTLVFTPTVELARLVSEEFQGAGIPAAYVHGGTPIDERREILDDYSAGRIGVLANCAVLTEGYDEPRTDCIVIARPTRSRALYAQMIGRGTRRHPDKADCLVLDMVDATAELSLVTIPSLFGIDRKAMADKLGDGSAGIGQVIDEMERELVREGKLTAHEIEMFAKVRSDGIAWVATHAPGESAYYRRSLGKGEPAVVLVQRETGWLAGVVEADGSKRVIMADVPMELAQGVAEDAVRKLAATSKHGAGIINADAKWRSRKPTPAQRRAAAKWHLQVDPKWTAGDLSDALDRRIASKKDRRKA